MFSPLHDEVLSMILKNLNKYQVGQDVEIFTGGSGEYTSTPFTPDDQEDSSHTDESNPSQLPGFDGYDYHILYNDDDDIIGFTTNNGTIRYTLNKDTFDDLISVLVEAPIVSFKVALIFQNYDIRVQGDSYVEDKGKLTDVVILDTQNKTFPVKLEINPGSEIIEIGSSIQFTAKVYFKDGSVQDVTETGVWEITSSETIENGLVTPSKIGEYMITICSNGLIGNALLNVRSEAVEAY